MPSKTDVLRVRLVADGAGKVKAQMLGVDDSFKKVDRSSSSLAAGIKKLSGSFGALGIAAGLGAATLALSLFSKETIAFNASISNLSAITGASGKDLEFFREQAKELGRTTTLSATQVANAFKLIASAKPDLLDSAQALTAVTNSAITLAEAASSDLQPAALALAGSLNQFNKGAEEATRFINVLAAGAKFGGSEISNTAEALDQVGIIAAQSGSTFEQTNAQIQVLAKGMILGSEAGVKLRNVYLNLAKSGKEEFTPSIVGLEQALKNVRDANLSENEALELFQKQNLAAGKVLIQFLPLLGDLEEKLTGTNTAFEQSATNLDNLSGDLKQLGSAFSGLGIEILGAQEPLRDLTQLATSTLNGITDNLDTLADSAKLVALIFAGRLANSLAKSGAAAFKAAAGFTALDVSMLAAVAQMRLATIASSSLKAALAFFGGPIGLGVLALGGAYVFLTRDTDGATEATEKYKEALDLANQSGKTAATISKETALARTKEAIETLKAAQALLALRANQIQENISSTGQPPSFLELGELEDIGKEYGEIQKAIEKLFASATKGPNKLKDAIEDAIGSTRELSSELKKLIDRLNPLQAKAKTYAAELATITGSNLGLEQQAELVRKLDEEFAKATGGPKKLKKSVEDVEEAAEKSSTGVADAFDRAADNIQRGFGDTFTEIFRNGELRFETFTDLIRDMFARLAGEIAALLVFRPAALSAGLGGLGLFGGAASAGAAAGGGAGASVAAGTAGAALAGGGAGFVNVPGLGPLSVASLQTTALAIGAGVAGNFVGSELSNLIGINRNAGGTVGGLVGGIGGAIIGGPFGAAVGAALGNVVGNTLGRAFGVGSGSNKQKFGFQTGTGTGIDSPFGTLSVTREREVDALAILRSLADIDKNLSGLLSDDQIARVRGSLAGTGQNFSVNSFDNEPFDVVKTRLIRIIDAVAENTVASGLLNSIGRDPGNIDQLVSESQRIIQLINSFKDEGGDLNSAEQAINSLNDQFDALSDAAEGLGFSLDEAEARRRQAIIQLTTDFDQSIRDQMLAIQDPIRLQLEAQERAAQERLQNARTLGANLVEVERLNLLERTKIADQIFGASNSSITRFLDSLLTGTAGGLTVAARAGNADTQFSSLLASARTDPAARQSLAGFLPGFVDLKREQFGSTSAFFEFKSFLDSTLRNLVDQGDTVATLNDIGSAITTGDNAIVESLNALRAENAELRADINLLLNKPAAA